MRRLKTYRSSSTTVSQSLNPLGDVLGFLNFLLTFLKLFNGSLVGARYFFLLEIRTLRRLFSVECRCQKMEKHCRRTTSPAERSGTTVGYKNIFNDYLNFCSIKNYKHLAQNYFENIFQHVSVCLTISLGCQLFQRGHDELFPSVSIY